LQQLASQMIDQLMKMQQVAQDSSSTTTATSAA